MTYRKLAQLAGVSLSTVSKALSGSSEISGETAARILRIAEENGVIRPRYRHDHPITRIAITVPEIVSVHYSQIVTLAVDELRRLGIEASIYICGFDDERHYRIIDMLCEEKLADGIIAMNVFKHPRRITLPVVCFGAGENAPYCDTITTDMQSGIFEALEYLISLGHRKIGFISEVNTNAKLNHFKSAAARLEHPVSPEYVFVSDKRFEAIGYDAAEYYLKLPDPPTALIAAYDEVALGAIHTFRSRKIRVPEDISVIGINDIPSSSYANIPLTTIRTFSSEIIHLCVKLLMDQIKNPEHHMVQHISVRCELIKRSTTARIK